MEFKLHNTLTKKIQIFKPLKDGHVSMYACGPTVYDLTHIGHMRKYTMDDILRRTLTYLGYNVNHVMNVTDVGHLSSDGDDGDDKLEKGALKHGKNVWDIANEYTDYFFNTMDALNVARPNIVAKATDHIPQMVSMVNDLIKNGNAYITNQAIYFDTTTYPDYGMLSGQNLNDKQQGVRDEVVTDPEKRHPADFSLWFFCVGRFADHTMRWAADFEGLKDYENKEGLPDGALAKAGFPGWHIECSAMSTHYLGDQIDIHTGGIDHIPVHHENEIAQSMCAHHYHDNEHFVNYWLHYDFLTVDGEKMSKSKNNFYTIDDIREHKINPLALRLYFMGTSYRKPLNFTWEGATSANNIYTKIMSQAMGLYNHDVVGIVNENYINSFKDAMCDDLNTARALAVVFELLGDKNITDADKYTTLVNLDQVLGLDIEQNITALSTIPNEIIELAEKRKTAKEVKNYKLADELRNEIDTAGYELLDSSDGYKIIKKL
jgi:cysteinyl-tRNA synthetase